MQDYKNKIKSMNGIVNFAFYVLYHSLYSYLFWSKIEPMFSNKQGVLF